MKKKLYRSQTDRFLGGVCGGVGEYFDVDPTLVRVLWVGSTLLFGSGFLLYVICWAIIPPRKE